MRISGGVSLMLSGSPDAVRGTAFHLGLGGRKNIPGLPTIAVPWSRNAGPKHRPLLGRGTQDTLPTCYASNSGVPNQLTFFLTPFCVILALFLVPFPGFWSCSIGKSKGKMDLCQHVHQSPTITLINYFLIFENSKHHWAFWFSRLQNVHV